jgi:hypothetical protein
VDILASLGPVALVGYGIGRRFAGRWVPARRSLLLPLVLVVVGVGQAAHLRWTALPAAVTAAPALSFGVSLAAPYAVFDARVARDGRPARPAGDRRRAITRSTLAR